MKIIKNTYPKHNNVPYAEIGDKVIWQMGRGCMELIRLSDSKVLFVSAPVDRNGLLRSNKKLPVVTGIIAQVKSKGWVLEVK